MSKLKKIKITKLSGKMDSSIQVGYWVVGYRMDIEPIIGKPYMLMPVEETSLKERWFDWFSTTAVSSFDNGMDVPAYGDGVITTKNSRWKIDIL